MSHIAALVFLPLLLALVIIILPRLLARAVGFAGTIVFFYLAIVATRLTGMAAGSWTVAGRTLLQIDSLSAIIVFFVGLMGVLIGMYALGTITEKEGEKSFWAAFLATLGASAGAVLSLFPGAICNYNFTSLLVFWGFLGYTLYVLVSSGGPRATAAAKKAFIIIGGSDALMIIGAVLYLLLIRQTDGGPLPVTGELSTVAFLFLALAALAKAGAFPLHTWIPDVAEKAPPAVSAFVPAALDKLVGIYFLVRLVRDYFIIDGTPAQFVLLAVGAFTIIAAVMMAMVQHNLFRLLGYHAVSQVGYMILAIAIATPLGIAAGLFHMLNNVIYKSTLFLTAGAVQRRAGTVELNRLGGLAKVMPITFVAFFIAALAISGVPPLNGFFSKWLIYQTLIKFGVVSKWWFVWLTAALFGSAMTLASFVKVTQAVFLGRSDDAAATAKVRESAPALWMPALLLAGFCVVVGAMPGIITQHMAFIEHSFDYGVWRPTVATALLLVALALGLTVYALGTAFKVRRDISYLGGEVHNEMRFPGTEFYRTVQERWAFGPIYALAKAGWFDLYEVGSRLVFYIVGIGRAAHSGLLSTYVTWVILGLAGILLVMVGVN